ncbi:hypothetical protein FRB95_005231 [Tulasnella sp. JGI-2019a]|nr:hypothetical protein FRB95_005231 [Tulasnella sp. JGI-2019a]
MIVFPDQDSDAEPNVIVPADEERTNIIPLDHRLSLHWRGWVGTFIADNLDWPLLKPWHLKDFPKGYTLVQTFRKNDPTKPDPYLYGYGKKQKFRSPQEFAFHAVWLFHPDYHQNHPCECTLCTHRLQGLITSIWIGVPGQRRRDEDRPMPEQGGYARRLGAVISRATSWGSITWTTPKRSLINGKSRFPLKSMPSRKYDLDLVRPYREGELVWVAIEALTPSDREQTDPEEEIKLWPATVAALPVQSRPPQPSAPSRTQYNIELLGVDHQQIVSFEKILSWRAYTLPDVISEQIQLPRMPSDIQVTPVFSAFKGFRPLPAPPSASDGHATSAPRPGFRSMPKPLDIPRTFENALGPLAVAQGKAEYIQERFYGTNPYSELEENSGHGSSEKICYQGVWWGAERIWVGDLVRLTCLRGDLENELEAAGLQHHLEDSSPNADQRQLFARIQEFSFDQAKNQLCLSAELYELADASDDLDTSEVGLIQHHALPPTTENGLPRPPFGFRFRKLTPPDVLIYLPIQLIAGRYDLIPSESIPHRQLLGILNTVTLMKFREREFGPDDPVGKRVGDLLALSGICVEQDPPSGPVLLVDPKNGRSGVTRDADIQSKREIYEHWVEGDRPRVVQ